MRTPTSGRLLDAASVRLRGGLRIQHLALVGLAVAGALSIFLLELISSAAAPRTPGHSVFAGNLTPVAGWVAVSPSPIPLPSATALSPTAEPLASPPPSLSAVASTHEPTGTNPPTSTPSPRPTREGTPTPTATFTVQPTAAVTVTHAISLTPTVTLPPAVILIGTLPATLTRAPPPTASPTPTFPARGPGEYLLPSQDTWIDESQPDANYGQDTVLRLGGNNGQRRRILIQFDLKGLPVGSQVNRASLHLWQDGKLSSIRLVVYRIGEAWREGEVTWTERATGQRWSDAGGNFTLNAERSIQLDADGPREIDLTNLVRKWVAGDVSNFGVMLTVQGGDGEVRFASREQGPIAGSERDKDLGPSRSRGATAYLGPALQIESGAPLLTPTPTPTRLFIPGPDPVPRPTAGPPAHGDGHGYSMRTATCGKCHRSHGNPGQALRTAWPEEALCLTCHDGTGAQSDIQAPFTRQYRHPISATAGVHEASERSPDQFRGSNRHVECEDCHEPHQTTRGSHAEGGNWAGGALQSTWGIAVTNGAAGALPRYAVVEPVTYEYQVCFKCHSAWSSVGKGTDVSRELNPNNFGYHPVEGPGRNQPDKANPSFAGTFRRPWGPESLVQCSDCHGSSNPSDASGVHGSDQRWLLRRNETGAGSETVFCFNCHRRQVYGDVDLLDPPNAAYSRYSHPGEAAHILLQGRTWSNPWGNWCMNCHGGDGPGGIHGSNRGTGENGATPLGLRLMNGAFVQGWTLEESRTTCWASCHSGPKTAGVNYNYTP